MDSSLHPKLRGSMLVWGRVRAGQIENLQDSGFTGAKQNINFNVKWAAENLGAPLPFCNSLSPNPQPKHFLLYL